MCGRYALHSRAHAIALQFGLAHEPVVAPSYNIAPGRPVLAVRAQPDRARGSISLGWGLLPPWARDPAIAHHLFNARAEHLAQKPAFRNAFLHRRCIVPADGFYEWHAAGGRREPYYVCPVGPGLFGFAAVYETHPGPTASAGTCVIVTVAANTVVAALNPRMPAILGIDQYAHWLDPDHPDPLSLLNVLRPAPASRMQAHRVGMRVNNVRNDDAQLIAPLRGTASPTDDELF